ncbi:MAG TPA: transposase [Flavisolibacter sp.]|jgi:transposase
MNTGSTVDLWDMFEPLVRGQLCRRPGAGRRRVDVRKVFEAVVWILNTGAPWRSIPEGIYPSYQTCHRYFQQWARSGVLKSWLTK